MTTILIGLEAPGLRSLCEQVLARQGYAVVPVGAPLAALRLVSQVEWDVALVDNSLLGTSTLQASALVSNRRLVGLGVDDTRVAMNLRLPLRDIDLISALEKLLPAAPPEQQELRLDAGRRIASAHGRSVALTRTEFRLLQLLEEKMPHDVAFADVLATVWGYTEADATPELVRSHLRNLRRKLGSIGLPDVLHSRRGRGYALTI